MTSKNYSSIKPIYESSTGTEASYTETSSGSFIESSRKEREICPICQIRLTDKMLLLSCGHTVCDNPKCSKKCKCGVCNRRIDKIIINTLFRESCMNCGKNYKSFLLCGRQKRKYNFKCHMICSSCVQRGKHKLTCPVCHELTSNKKLMHTLTNHKYSEIKIVKICYSGSKNVKIRNRCAYIKEYIIGITKKCKTGYMCKFISPEPSCGCGCKYRKESIIYWSGGKRMYHKYGSKYHKCHFITIVKT